ncbi:MAG: class I SAM-dependent methyltransferase [Anaerolineales bacterium]|nr:class I SAM-dependent methyltransferase [Anaerolineales bacterium]
MPDPKEKVRLTAEQETLMITLYCKTLAAPKGAFSDAEAWRVVERIDYDFSRLKLKPGTRLTVFMRAKRLDHYVRGFLSRAPDGIVLHLGCGLDTRHARVDNGSVRWFDLDLPDVIALRRKLFAESPRYRMIASSVTDFRWLKEIPRGKPAFIVAEGLLMYLAEEKVKELLLRLRDAFAGCEIAFDAFSTLTARNIKRADVLKTTGATVRWGIDDPKWIETWAPGIRLKEEWTFMQSEDIRKLGAANFLMFKLAGLFPAAAKAHRILYYSL